MSIYSVEPAEGGHSRIFIWLRGDKYLLATVFSHAKVVEDFINALPANEKDFYEKYGKGIG